MTSIRTPLSRLTPETCDHPYLAFEKLIVDGSVKGDGKRQHQVAALQRSLPAPLREAYHLAFERRYQALRNFQGGMEGAVTKFFQIRVSGRLAAGLGNASVLENGLSLNHTFGLPYLPGTGLKGMASAMAHLGLAGDSWKRGVEMNGKWDGQGQDHKILFGTMDTSAEDAAAGIVVFHDAWWDPEPVNGEPEALLPFQPDVMTPHHRTYNLEGSDWPNDWESPIPVPYVTTCGIFRLALTGPEEWVEAAFEILQMAFQHLGFGAKTQIGYGRGELEEHLSKEEEEFRKKKILEDKRKAVAVETAKLERAEADRLATLPRLEPVRGVLKPIREGGLLKARVECSGWVEMVTQEGLGKIAPDIAEALWSRLQAGREPKVLVTIAMDGNVRRILTLSLPS